MNKVDTIRKLLIRGIQLNNWILENPIIAENELDEWNDIADKVSSYTYTDINIIHKDEFDYLITTYEDGMNVINEFISKRIIINEIKASILEERLKNA